MGLGMGQLKSKSVSAGESSNLNVLWLMFRESMMHCMPSSSSSSSTSSRDPFVAPPFVVHLQHVLSSFLPLFPSLFACGRME